MTVVSVGVPVYNGEKYLAATLDCLLAQTLRNFELVICDNASTDRTAEISRAYQNKDERIRYVRNERNIGAAPTSTGWPSSRGRLCSMAAPAMISTNRGSSSAASRRSDAIRALVLSYARTKMIDEDGQALPFDRDRNCYIDGYGDVLMTGAPALQSTHLAGGPPRAAVPGGALADGLVAAAVRRGPSPRTAQDHALSTTTTAPTKSCWRNWRYRGRFYQVPEELFAKRVHCGGTHYKTTRERAQHESTDSAAFRRSAWSKTTQR